MFEAWRSYPIGHADLPFSEQWLRPLPIWSRGTAFVLGCSRYGENYFAVPRVTKLAALSGPSARFLPYTGHFISARLSQIPASLALP